MKKTVLLLVTSSCLALSHAAHIGVNFSENDGNQAWTNLVDTIGPLETLTANFNPTNNPTGGPGNVRTGTLAAGTLEGLVDDSGTAVSTTVTWASANAWYSGSGTADNEARLAVGYLDDGGAGATIDVINIPYDSYDVYVLLNSDAGPTHDSEVPLINGTPVLDANFPAFGNLAGSGGLWIEADGVTRGNYVVGRGISGSTLNIAGQNNTGNRIGIAGFIIEEVDRTDGDGDGLPDSWETANNLDPGDDGTTNPDNGADGNPDGDGLTNLEEFQRGTDPRDADSDDDSLNDEVETNTGIYVDDTNTGTDPNEADSDGDTLADNLENNSGVFNSATDPGTDPNAADTDGDGFPDNIENNSGINNGAGDPGTNPNLSDTDMDNLPDDWEVANLLDPGSAVGDNGEQGDGDNDGSPNSRELAQGTDPNDSDSDDDNLLDGVEDGTGIFVDATMTGSSPLNADTDGDTLTDDLETGGVSGTDPNLADTDGDFFRDDWELANNRNPLNADDGLSSDNGAIGLNFGAGRGANAFLELTDEAGIARQTNWNNLSGATGDQVVLVDEQGADSGATVTWATEEEWSAGAPETPDGKLLTGWVTVIDGAISNTISIAAIPFANYDLVVYTNHDRGFEDVVLSEASDAFPAVRLRENDPDVAGLQPLSQQVASAEGDLTQAGSFFYIPGVSGDNIDLIMNGGGDLAGQGSTNRGAITAIQIISAEPSIKLEITDLTRTPSATAGFDDVTITWRSVAGRTYGIETGESLNDFLEIDDVTAIGPLTSYTQTVPSTTVKGFYRVIEQD